MKYSHNGYQIELREDTGRFEVTAGRDYKQFGSLAAARKWLDNRSEPVVIPAMDSEGRKVEIASAKKGRGSRYSPPSYSFFQADGREIYITRPFVWDEAAAQKLVDLKQQERDEYARHSDAMATIRKARQELTNSLQRLDYDTAVSEARAALKKGGS